MSSILLSSRLSLTVCRSISSYWLSYSSRLTRSVLPFFPCCLCLLLGLDLSDCLQGGAPPLHFACQCPVCPHLLHTDLQARQLACAGFVLFCTVTSLNQSVVSSLFVWIVLSCRVFLYGQHLLTWYHQNSFVGPHTQLHSSSQVWLAAHWL